MNKIPLINALRNVARRLETSSADYDWHSVASCNCGLVAQELLKLDGTALNDLIRRDNSVNGWFENLSHGWSTMARAEFCQTGLPLSEIFQRLHRCGLSAKDICELEYLSNKRILGRMGWTFDESDGTEKCKEIGFLINYLRSWADLLSDEEAAAFVSLEPSQSLIPRQPQDSLNLMERPRSGLAPTRKSQTCARTFVAREFRLRNGRRTTIGRARQKES